MKRNILSLACLAAVLFSCTCNDIIQDNVRNAEKQLAGQNAKLANENFVSRAPEAVVNAEREKKAKLESLIANLKLSLENLGK